ncbi:unnamed protein product [Dibothriocephalus latus]|uniref:CCR4-Not complex component Not1 C-terminal domain-containing protein n=1 Tax=Dibothriocephalus latus TaxID=60516 RepID=A0A3P7PLK4_DIBLA|nr:unnamed protein product [Dibothriocephalus latus]
MSNLVLYICITAIRSLRERSQPLNMTTIAHTPQMDIIQSLVLNLDNEGRYLLLNCMANQLRYPNSYTYYFSYTILYLFSEQSKEQVKEQISRVLMERLIVNRPHPWGLLMTSAELLRNPAYRFWEHEFARCHSEMEIVVTLTTCAGRYCCGARHAIQFWYERGGTKSFVDDLLFCRVDVSIRAAITLRVIESYLYACCSSGPSD